MNIKEQVVEKIIADTEKVIFWKENKNVKAGHSQNFIAHYPNGIGVLFRFGKSSFVQLADEKNLVFCGSDEVAESLFIQLYDLIEAEINIVREAELNAEVNWINDFLGKPAPENDLEILIVGGVGSGKTSVALLLNDLLESRGANVSIIDDNSDSRVVAPNYVASCIRFKNKKIQITTKKKNKVS